MKTKNWFNRLLISYLPAFVIISICLLTITFLVISEISKKAALKSNDVLALNIMQQLDFSLENIESTLLNEITKSKPTIDFFSQKGADSQLEQFQAAFALNQLLANNPLIDSAYLYRPSDDTVVSPVRIISLQEFGDGSFVTQTMRSLDPFVWEGPRKYQECLDFCESHDVVTLTRAAYMGSKGLMVINVKTSSLHKLIAQMSDLELNHIRLTDAGGRPILTESAGETGKAQPGFGFTGISGNNGSLTSPYTGWTLHTEIYPSKIFYFVSNLFYLWITLAIAVIVFGIVWIVYISRRHYKPVRMILDEIDREFQHKQEEEAPRSDEFIYIQSTLRKLVVNSQLLQDENKENLIFRKQFLFQELMNGNLSSQVPRPELERFHVNGVNVGFVFIVAEIDTSAQFEDAFLPRDQELFKIVLKNVVVEVAEQDDVPVWAEWIDRNRLGALYPSLTGTENPRTAELCEKVRLWVESNLKFTVTIGIGIDADTTEQIVESYESACKALEYKASLGSNRIIQFAELGVLPQGEMFRQLNRIRIIAQQFRLGEEKWESQYRVFYEELSNQLFSKDDLLNLFHYLIYHLHKETAELTQDFYDIWHLHTLPKLHEALRLEDTFEGVYRLFEETLRESAARMHSIRQNDNRFHFIQKVRGYIEEYYADPNLSLSQISDVFELSPSYLSRLFKEELGEKFIDYVTQVRINHAKRLLEVANDSIQDIASKVGYVNALTFIRVFKKITGDTPGSYRKK